MFLHYLCRKNTSMQSRNILNIKIFYVIISFLYFVIIESYRKIYPLIPREYILYVFEICILSFIAFFFHVSIGKQKVLKIFYICFDRMKKIEILRIFLFFSRKQRKNFLFQSQTPNFRNICFFAELHLRLPCFFFFFSPGILLMLTISFHFSTIHRYLRVNLKEEVRDRSKSRLTLNDFVPPAPSRHQDEEKASSSSPSSFSSSSLSSALASPRNSTVCKVAMFADKSYVIQ